MALGSVVKVSRPGGERLGEDLLEAGLVEGRHAPAEPVDLGGVDVEAHHVVAEPRHARSVNRAQIATADHRDMHVRQHTEHGHGAGWPAVAARRRRRPRGNPDR